MKTHGQVGYEQYLELRKANGLRVNSVINDWDTMGPAFKNVWEQLFGEVPDPFDGDPGARAIAVERSRQRNQEGWTYSHDDEHTGSELALMAAHYVLLSARDATQYHTQDGLIASPLTRLIDFVAPQLTPGEWHSKPGTSIRNLEKAGALIAAEISRLKRCEHQKNRRDQWEVEHQQSTNSKKNAV